MNDNRKPIVDKTYLLEESKTFCMFPWLHLNVTPKGDIYPCCSNNYTDPFGNTKETSLKEAFNSDKMKQLRLDMLNGKKNSVENWKDGNLVLMIQYDESGKKKWEI